MNHLRQSCIVDPFSEVTTGQQGDAVRKSITSHEFQLQLPIPTTQNVSLQRHVGLRAQSDHIIRARNLYTKRFQTLEEKTLCETLVGSQRLHPILFFVALVLLETFQNFNSENNVISLSQEVDFPALLEICLENLENLYFNRVFIPLACMFNCSSLQKV